MFAEVAAPSLLREEVPSDPPDFQEGVHVVVVDPQVPGEQVPQDS